MTNLQKMRIERGMTQQELSSRSGVPLQTIQRLEIGYRTVDKCALERALRIADALTCDVREIMEKQD